MIPASHHGTWKGSNRLWLSPAAPAEISEGTLVASAEALSIRWASQGTAHHGQLELRGPPTSCRGDFTDSFHAASGMVLHGRVSSATLVLFGTYPAGAGLPDWGWRIEVDWSDPDHLTLHMVNVEPSGAEAMAVALVGAR